MPPLTLDSELSPPRSKPRPSPPTPTAPPMPSPRRAALPPGAPPLCPRRSKRRSWRRLERGPASIGHPWASKEGGREPAAARDEPPQARGRRSGLPRASTGETTARGTAEPGRRRRAALRVALAEGVADGGRPHHDRGGRREPRGLPRRWLLRGGTVVDLVGWREADAPSRVVRGQSSRWRRPHGQEHPVHGRADPRRRRGTVLHLRWPACSLPAVLEPHLHLERIWREGKWSIPNTCSMRISLDAHLQLRHVKLRRHPRLRHHFVRRLLTDRPACVPRSARTGLV